MVPVDRGARPAEFLPARSSGGQAGARPFDDEIALELGENGRDPEKEFSLGSGCIEAGIFEGDKLDLIRAENFGEAHQLGERTRQAIEAPDQNDVKIVRVNRGQQSMEPGPAMGFEFRRNPVIDVLAPLDPAAAIAVFAELVKLELRILVERRNPNIDRDARNPANRFCSPSLCTPNPTF